MSVDLVCVVEELNEADVHQRCSDDADVPLHLPIKGKGNVVVTCQGKNTDENGRVRKLTPKHHGSQCWAAPALNYALKEEGFDVDAMIPHNISNSAKIHYNSYPFNVASSVQLKFVRESARAMIDRMATLYSQDEPKTDNTPSVAMDFSKWHAIHDMKDDQVLWARRPLKDFYELYFTSRGEEYAHIFEAYQNRFGGANGTPLSEDDNASFTAVNAELLSVEDLQMYIFEELAFKRSTWEQDLNGVKSIVEHFSHSAFQSISDMFSAGVQRVPFETALKLVMDGELRCLAEMRRIELSHSEQTRRSHNLIYDYILHVATEYVAPDIIRTLIVEGHKEHFESIVYLQEKAWEISKYLSFYKQGLSEIPVSIFSVLYQDLTVLNLVDNQLTRLPAALPAALPKLRELYLAKNPSLLTVPATFKNVGSFQELEILDISTHFSISEAGVKKVFPSYEFFTWFDGCSKLRELYFEGYKIDDFAFGFLDTIDVVGEIRTYFQWDFWNLIVKFPKVEHLSFSGNQFTKIPEWFIFPKSLKSLKISSHVSALFRDKLFDFELLVGVDMNGMYDPEYSIYVRKEEENLFPEIPGTRRSVMPLYVDYVLLDDQLTKAFEHFEKALNWLYQGQETRHPDDDVPYLETGEELLSLLSYKPWVIPSDICFVRPYLRLMTRMLQSSTTKARGMRAINAFKNRFHEGEFAYTYLKSVAPMLLEKTMLDKIEHGDVGDKRLYADVIDVLSMAEGFHMHEYATSDIGYMIEKSDEIWGENGYHLNSIFFSPNGFWSKWKQKGEVVYEPVIYDLDTTPIDFAF